MTNREKWHYVATRLPHKEVLVQVHNRSGQLVWAAVGGRWRYTLKAGVKASNWWYSLDEAVEEMRDKQASNPKPWGDEPEDSDA